MGKIYIDHLYLCSSYSETKEISENLSRFSFVFRTLGVKRTIRPKRYIRKRKNDQKRSHTLTVRYQFDFAGDFCEYGFIDKYTLHKHPELPTQLLGIDEWDRWEHVYNLADPDDYRGNPEYHKDFQSYFDRELKHLIDKLYLTETIALPFSKSGGFYAIYYEECGQAYEMRYCAEKGIISPMHSLRSLQSLEQLDFQQTWNWIHRYRKYSKEKWHTEVRPLTAWSYAINREPFEQFFYAILGLESVYTNGNRKSEGRKITRKDQLKEMLPRVFPDLTSDDVENFYELRSNFVHGNITFPNFYNSSATSYTRFEYTKEAQRVDYLLLRTIQLLVKNDAHKIRNNGAGGIAFVST